MSSSSIARSRCYILLQGIEQSLFENLMMNYDINEPKFLDDYEIDRALKRLREDFDDPIWGYEDVQHDDLIRYLDLGDLINLLNRHLPSLKNAKPSHIKSATKFISEKGIISIRKRVMHPIRPLEPDDLSILLDTSHKLNKIAPSLIWDPLLESINRLSKEDELLDVSIPTDFEDDPPIIYNLPPAEFDDTGFIGRSKERMALKKLLISDQRVITVVGEGGKGKTALALRVCNDILDDNDLAFDRIVWVSMKTRHLTPEGVREIADAVDSIHALVNVIFKAILVETNTSELSSWDRVIEQMKATKTLLVIDNLETIGGEIRDLLLYIPSGSKVLLTSRVGLGELELRYELPDFNLKNAMQLFRSLVQVHNYKHLQSLKDSLVRQYCGELDHNPLLIKWFVQAVGRGADPATLLNNSGFDEALTFCYANVYDRLNPVAKKIVTVLLASRRELSKAQLQDIMEIQHVPFIKACTDLICSSIVERLFKEDGAQSFRISGLVYGYLSKNYPPDNTLVSNVRQRISIWQAEQDKSASQSEIYRYGPSTLHVEKLDERISVQHLYRALKAAKAGDFDMAHMALQKAEDLTPSWWEIYRVQAYVLERQGRPIYEIEEAFEKSIQYKDIDINRYHYAVFLIRSNEFDRGIEQIDKALEHAEALSLILEGLKGLALMRMGQLDPAIEKLSMVWEDRSSDIPSRIVRTQGTQLANAYRRRGAQQFSRGNKQEAINELVEACKIVTTTISDFGCDEKLVEEALNIFTTFTMQVWEDDVALQNMKGIASIWDKHKEFQRYVFNYWRAVLLFHQNPRLGEMFPIISKKIPASPENAKHYIGTVKNINRGQFFGFVNCTELNDVHFNKFSFIEPGEWDGLNIGDQLEFQVIGQTKGPHATDMKRVQPV